MAGSDGGGRPHWALHGKLLFSGRPAAAGTGSEAADAANEPAGVLDRAAARSALELLVPPPRPADCPHPTSLAGIALPPIISGVQGLVALLCPTTRCSQMMLE